MTGCLSTEAHHLQERNAKKHIDNVYQQKVKTRLHKLS